MVIVDYSFLIAVLINEINYHLYNLIYWDDTEIYCECLYYKK